MIKKTEYFDLLDEIAGKIIAIVYIFEGEDAKGFGHYDIWRSNLISCWLNAIQELKCVPYILDVRTFLYKVSNNTLPHIDYVINMNAGCENLSTLGLVPSVCGFNALECIPCNTSTIIAGENKEISNMIAEYCSFNVPCEITKDEFGIFRPLNYGSSKGVKLVDGLSEESIPGILQEFIPGYDVTTPIMYNPLTEKLDALPTIFYSPDKNDVDWYLGNETKSTVSGFKRKVLTNVDIELIEKYINLADKFGIETYCRIDCRLHTTELLDLSDMDTICLNNDNCYFIEMNPMPTIEIDNNFYASIKNLSKKDTFYNTITSYNKHILRPTVHGFILSCAIIQKLISKHKK